MSEDGFLARWSRRKRGEAETPAAATPALPEEEAPALAEEDLAERLKSLPSIEDLKPDSSLAPFLQAWVPESLRNRAMRRMWSIDPAIRDFIAPESERYDFDKPGAMFSHGPLNLDDGELRAMTDRILGGGPREAPADKPPGALAAPEVALREAPVPPAEIEKPAPEESGPAKAAVPPRRHGGAIPS